MPQEVNLWMNNPQNLEEVEPEPEDWEKLLPPETGTRLIARMKQMSVEKRTRTINALRQDSQLGLPPEITPSAPPF